MNQFLQLQRDQKIQELQFILKQGNYQSILSFEKQWWVNFNQQHQLKIQNQHSDSIINATRILQQKVTKAFTFIKQKLSVDEQIQFICGDSDEQCQQSDEVQIERSAAQQIEDNNSHERNQQRFNREDNKLSQQLNKMKQALEECQSQNAQLMKRLVKSLQRCSALIQKVDKLKQQNIHLQTQDHNSMKYYQRLLSENKKELKEKDEMIRLYQIKLQVYRGQQSPNSKLTDRGSPRGYLYTSQGILDRIQSLRILAKGKMKSKSNATQIEEIS